MFDPDICRSLLFVPADNARYLRSALRGAADVIQIDLEDAIAPAQKERARNSARSFVAQAGAPPSASMAKNRCWGQISKPSSIRVWRR